MDAAARAPLQLPPVQRDLWPPKPKPFDAALGLSPSTSVVVHVDKNGPFPAAIAAAL